MAFGLDYEQRNTGQVPGQPPPATGAPTPPRPPSPWVPRFNAASAPAPRPPQPSPYGGGPGSEQSSSSWRPPGSPPPAPQAGTPAVGVTPPPPPPPPPGGGAAPPPPPAFSGPTGNTGLPPGMSQISGDPTPASYYWDLYNRGLDPMTGLPRSSSAPPPPGGGGAPPPPGGGAPPPPPSNGTPPPSGGAPTPSDGGAMMQAWNALSAIDPNTLWAYEQNQVNNGVRYGHDEYDALMRYLPQRISSQIGQPGGYSLGGALNRYLEFLRGLGYGS